MIKRLSALALVALALSACASGSKPAAGTPTPEPAKAAPATAPTSNCTACTVEVENRMDYQVLIFDKRDTRNEIGTIKEVGKAQAKATALVQTRGRPNLGISVLQDTGVPPTSKGQISCRQEPVRPGSKADFRYVCGN